MDWFYPLTHYREFVVLDSQHLGDVRSMHVKV